MWRIYSFHECMCVCAGEGGVRCACLTRWIFLKGSLLVVTLVLYVLGSVTLLEEDSLPTTNVRDVSRCQTLLNWLTHGLQDQKIVLAH